MSYQFSTTTSFSDETYLESFVESISASLPSEMRRNLEHLRDLDHASSNLMEDWRERQDGCLRGVEETLLEFFRGEAAAAATADEEEKRDNKRKWSALSPDNKKVACRKCRAKKVRCDGKQPYCLFRKKATSPEESDSDGDVNDTDISPKKQKVEAEELHKDESGEGTEETPPISPSQISEFLQKRDPPTNEEIQTALQTHNPQYKSQRDNITNMYHELQQFSNEKINTVNQLKSMVDMVLGRMNRDLEKFEKKLGIEAADNTNTSSKAAAAAGTNKKMGAGANSGVVGHRPHAAAPAAGRQKQRSNSNAASMARSSVASSAPKNAAAATGGSANSIRKSSSSASTTLPPQTSTITQPPSYPSMRGVIPPPPKSVQTTNLAAIQVTPNSPDWILAKILSHDKSTKTYTLSDEDVQSNQVYTIPDRQVVALKGTERNKWARGDEVFAVYPDTTSFYHATVSTPTYNGFVMVHFKDDWDANGVTHEKAVLMQHVMKVPPGAK